METSPSSFTLAMVISLMATKGFIFLDVLIVIILLITIITVLSATVTIQGSYYERFKEYSEGVGIEGLDIRRN